MGFKEFIKYQERAITALFAKNELVENWGSGRASCTITHKRPREWVQDPKTGLLVPQLTPIKRKFGPGADFDPFDEIGETETVWNLITNVGRIQLHTAGYGTTGLPSNGFNYIALSNDAVSETAASTTLSNEIAANGLSRAQGTVTLPTGSGTQTTIARTFTATGSQSAQKAALFDASSSGDMNHVLAFTQRSLITNDTLAVTFTITLGA